MSNAPKGIFYAIIVAVLWGVLAVALKVSLNTLTPADITWFRFFLAFTALFLYYSYKKPQYLNIFKAPPLLLIVATVCLAVNYYGFIEGLSLTTPSIAQVFIQLGPVLLAISGFVFFHEKVTLRQIFGLFLVALGLIVFYRQNLQSLSNGQGAWRLGILWVLVGAISWAVYSVLLKVLVLRHPPMQLNLVIFGLPVLLYLPFVHFSHFIGLGWVDWSILMFLGLNTLFAYGLLSLAIHFTEANKVSVILVLNPILTMAIMAILSHTRASWITHEHYSLVTLGGALIVLTGAVLTILKKNKPGKKIN